MLNAIREAARIIADLDELRAAADADDSVAVVVNIGAIQGGDKVNMIANHCRVEVDLRCPLGLKLDDLLERFGAIVARAAPPRAGVS